MVNTYQIYCQRKNHCGLRRGSSVARPRDRTTQPSSTPPCAASAVCQPQSRLLSETFSSASHPFKPAGPVFFTLGQALSGLCIFHI